MANRTLHRCADHGKAGTGLAKAACLRTINIAIRSSGAGRRRNGSWTGCWRRRRIEGQEVGGGAFFFFAAALPARLGARGLRNAACNASRAHGSIACGESIAASGVDQ